MAADARIDETLAPGADDRGAELGRLAPGATLGHFRILRELGAGGMGVVLEAYDPDLDRHVAIKVVRDRDAGSASSGRLLREAQAMAKLAHPNVIPVHEVGTIDGQVYVVMELVRGDTLARWLDIPRSWREIVHTFVQAGHGLEAAHRAGLVHRDFKPTNVLVDDVHHVRVGDFGLARASHDDTGELATGSEPAGTPAYMAPEQRRGEPIDARADQYAFATSLGEALASQPVVGRVPRRVRRAIARGRATDRAARFEQLGQLLDELRGALEVRRLAIVVGAVAVALAAVIAVGITSSARSGAPDCTTGAGLVDGVWTVAERVALVARFAAVRSHSVATTSTVRALDAWADAWRLGRRAACLAEPAQRPARLACLDRHLGELRAQLAAWTARVGGDDAAVVDRALAAVTGLPDPAACATQSGIAPTLAAIAIDDRAAHVAAETRAGRAAQIVEELPELRSDAEATHDPRAIASAFVVSAEAERETGAFAPAREHAARAALEAGRAGDDDLMFRALVDETTLLVDLGQPRASLGIVDAAAAVSERGHLDRGDRLASLRGDALAQAGDLPEAITELARAVTLAEARARRDPAAQPALSTTLGELAGAYEAAHRYSEAHQLLERCLAIDEATLGPDHPETAKTLHDLAGTEAHAGQFDAALAHDARARAILVHAYGKRHVLVATLDVSVAGIVLAQRGDDAAEPLFTVAATELAGLVPVDHPYVGEVEEALGTIASDRDRCGEAIPHLQRALSITEHAGRGGAARAMQTTSLGACMLDLGRTAEARPLLEQALADFAAAGVPMPEQSQAMSVLADLEYREGHRRVAIAMARQILTMLGRDPKPPWDQIATYEHKQLAKWGR